MVNNDQLPVAFWITQTIGTGRLTISMNRGEKRTPQSCGISVQPIVFNDAK